LENISTVRGGDMETMEVVQKRLTIMVHELKLSMIMKGTHVLFNNLPIFFKT
jgi:hypothetical protein